jgi:radical SAM superfamily enzyme YgiQ (UPF0313 family)
MKVIFLEFDTESSWAVASLGPAFLAAYLRQHGHEAGFIRIPHDQPIEEIATIIRQEIPGLIGVSLTSRQWLRAREIIGGLRRISNIPVIAGGLHATFSPEDILAHEGFDYVCIGKGEAVLLELVNVLDDDISPVDAQIANIWVRGGERPRLRESIEPLDSIPFMARDMLDERWGVHHVSTQRGCPFPCTYCAARMFDKLYSEGDTSDYGRRLSHGNVLAELAEIQSRGPLNYVIFLDDTFTIHQIWVREFCKVYKRDFAIPFSLHARVETVNKEMLQELAEAGCRHITYGVESGSERVRREIMKRLATNQRFRDVFRWTKDAGIIPTANYIIGTPGEPIAEMQETMVLHRELQPVDFGYFVFYPYPGTDLFQTCRENGWLPEDYLTRPANHRQSILNLPNVTQEQPAEIYDVWTVIRATTAAARSLPADTEQVKIQVLEAALRG